MFTSINHERFFTNMWVPHIISETSFLLIDLGTSKNLSRKNCNIHNIDY